ncbi:hypothetical protein LCGC14_1677290 [marine sediment metagenome]|uniref:Uncharacterized protein n=1 Tax=marine sediment metagenome TaxID=412755 RepID=A0A0F9IC18_9ZZZZ
METYDDIVHFNYLDLEEWKNYAKTYLVPLQKNALLLSEFRSFLLKKTTNNLKEFFNNNESIRKILLGGINEQGHYEPNSLAEIIKKTLGIEIMRREYIYHKRLGNDPFDKGVKCKSKKTLFRHFIKQIKMETTKILTSLSIETSTINSGEIDEIFNNPEKILDIIKGLYTKILSFSANYNQQTFFIRNFYCIPYFYILEAYPKLKSNFDILKDILGLKESFIPSIKDEDKERLTIWGYADGGLAEKIFSLQNLFELYLDFSDSFITIPGMDEMMSRENFTSIINMVIKDPINLAVDYIKKIEEEITLPYSLEFQPYRINISGYNKNLQLILINQKIVKVTNGYSPKTRYAFYLERPKIHISEFIETIAPFLFLGVAELFEIESIHYPKILESGERGKSRFLEFRNQWS